MPPYMDLSGLPLLDEDAKLYQVCCALPCCGAPMMAKKSEHQAYREGWEAIFGKERPSWSNRLCLPVEAPDKIKYLVARSAVLLDRHMPDWYEVVDLEDFVEQRQGKETIFTQLWPLKRLWLKFVHLTHVDYKQLTKGMIPETDEDEYWMGLTWFYEILDRKLTYKWRKKFLELCNGQISGEVKSKKLCD